MKNLLFLLLPMLFFCQEPTFSASSSTKNLELNTELKNAIDSKDISILENYLYKNKKKINDAVVSESVISNDISITKLKPALHYIYEKCENQELGLDFLKQYIRLGADLHSDYNGESILYRDLDKIATTTKNKTKINFEILKIIFEEGKLNINQNYKSFLQPFTYLIRKNFEYLNNQYNNDYIDSEIIKYFIDHDANIESFDNSGNGLLALAISKNDDDLTNYLISKNINVNKENNQGKDPLYFAIKNNKEELVETIVNKLEKDITPSYLYKIEVHNLDIYKSDKTVSFLLNKCYPNIKDFSDIIIFSKIFYKDRNKLLNPIPIAFSDDLIPDFVAIFKNDNLGKHENEVLRDLKIRYINGALDFRQLQLRLSNIPLFTISHYYEDVNKMISNNNLQLLKNEINNIPNEFLSLKYRLQSEYNEIKANCEQKIANNKLAQVFKENLKNTSNEFYIFKGDGATFWETVSLDEYNKFKKYKLCLISMFKNNSNSTLKVKTSVRFNYLVKNNVWLFSKSSHDYVYMNSYVEVPPHQEMPVFTTLDFKETATNIGVLGSAKLLDDDNPYTISYEPFYGNIDNDYVANQKEIYTQLKNNGKLNTQKGWDDVIEYACNNCDIDEKNSKGPKWEVQGWIWKELVQKEGVIAMKNGAEYKFLQKVKNGKLYYELITGFLEANKEYDNFDKMIIDFLKNCKAKHCNN